MVEKVLTMGRRHVYNWTARTRETSGSPSDLGVACADPRLPGSHAKVWGVSGMTISITISKSQGEYRMVEGLVEALDARQRADSWA